MIHDRQPHHEQREPAHHGREAHAHEAQPDTTAFESEGRIPAAEEGFAEAGRTASERAFDSPEQLEAPRAQPVDEVHHALGQHGLSGVDVTTGAASEARTAGTAQPAQLANVDGDRHDHHDDRDDDDHDHDDDRDDGGNRQESEHDRAGVRAAAAGDHDRKRKRHRKRKRKHHHNRHKHRPMEMVAQGVEFNGATQVVGPDGQMQVVASERQTAAFAAAAKAGITTLRYWIVNGTTGIWGGTWADTGPNFIANQIRNISNDIIAARQLGYDFKYQIVLTPSRDEPTNWKNAPTRHNPKQFGRFVTQAVSALSELGVHRYSIGNEPNLKEFNNPHPKNYSYRGAARSYRRLYDAGYKAAHRADDDAQVLVGELASHRVKEFLREFLEADDDPVRAEGFAYHAYQFSNNPNEKPSHDFGIGNLGALKRLLHKLRDDLHTRNGKELPLYITEFGYFRQPYKTREPWSDTAEKDGHWSRRHAAVVALKMALKHHVREMAQYMFFHADKPVWDTGIASYENGQVELDPTGKAIARWLERHRRFMAERAD